MRMRLPGVLLGAVMAVQTAIADEIVPVEIVPVAGHVSMLKGRGGNIGVSTGPDGVVLIDDQFAVQVPGIRAALARLGDAEPRFVINTHWHYDHTGGNESFARGGALLVAHDNARHRLSTDQVIAFFGTEIPAVPDEALPVVTFSTDIRFHLNGDTVHAFHVPAAHTDGDIVIFFERANVVHMGDVFFHEMYPFIDAGAGGSVSGMIAAVDRVLAMVDDHTRIIPGHGELTDRKGLEAYRAMLDGAHQLIAAQMIAGQTVDEIVQSKPTRAFDATWARGSLDPDTWVRLVVDAITRETLR